MATRTQPAKKKSGASSGCRPNPKKRADADKQKHKAPLNEVKLHKCVDKNTEGGACLYAHNLSFGYKEVSCCYRWQTHEIAKTRDTEIFNDRSNNLRLGRYASRRVTTSAYRTKKRTIYPPVARYSTKIDRPQYLNDWALEGPERPSNDSMKRGKKVVPNGENFTRDTWPYWNNAHHLIPKGTFWIGVNGGFDNDPEYRVFKLIRTSLLEAEYNINYKENMLFLPMDAEVARLLKLPRHLSLSSGSTKTNHPAYNDKVEERLEQIINDYKEICDQAFEDDHPEPKADLDKQKLIDLSKDCYSEVLTFGEASPGKPIDDIEEINLY